MLRRKSPAVVFLPLLSAAVALALTGCSGGTKTVDPEEGPLGKYMAALWENEEWDEAKFDEQQTQIEELAAVCMQKEGFEYKPNVQTGMMGSFDDEDGPQWGTEEFAKEFGYGMSTDPWGNMSPGGEEDFEEHSDPNQEYIDSLSESEQEAFYETLYGGGPSEEQIAEMDETGSYSSDWTQEGCQGAARHEVEQDAQGAEAAYEDPEFADLFEAINDMYAQLWEPERKHDELVQLDVEWTNCMADSGYSEYSSPDDANMQISEELNEIYMMDQDPEGDWTEPTQADTDKMNAEIEKFKEHEIAVAVADFECKKKTNYTDKATKVQFDLEQQFVDENKAELDAMLAKYAAKSEAK